MTAYLSTVQLLCWRWSGPLLFCRVNLSTHSHKGGVVQETKIFSQRWKANQTFLLSWCNKIPEYYYISAVQNVLHCEKRLPLGRRWQSSYHLWSAQEADVREDETIATEFSSFYTMSFMWLLNFIYLRWVSNLQFKSQRSASLHRCGTFRRKKVQKENVHFWTQGYCYCIFNALLHASDNDGKCKESKCKKGLLIVWHD